MHIRFRHPIFIADFYFFRFSAKTEQLDLDAKKTHLEKPTEPETSRRWRCRWIPMWVSSYHKIFMLMVMVGCRYAVEADFYFYRMQLNLKVGDL